MKKRLTKSIAAAVCAIALIGSTTLPLAENLPFLSDTSISASAAGSVKLSNGTLTLSGAISKSAVRAYAGKQVTNVVCTSGTVFPADCSNMFEDFTATKIDLTNADTSKVTNMQAMFAGCDGLTWLDIENFNTAKVTNMKGMFLSCSSLNELNLINFNTANVTTMESMFLFCTALKRVNLSTFNTAKVTNMSSMFFNCYNLNTIIASTAFSTAKASSSGTMFYGCSKLKGGNGSSYSGSYVNKTYARIDKSGQKGYFTQNSCTFNPTTGVLNLSGKVSLDEVLDYSFMPSVKSVTTSAGTVFPEDCGCMFTGNQATSINLSNANTANTTNMAFMFDNCKNLTSLTLGSNFSTAKVTTMESMFAECPSLTSLNLTKFNTANVTSMYGMFAECPKLQRISVSGAWTTAKVTSSSVMFINSKALKGGNGTTYNSSYTDKTYARIDKASQKGYLTLG